MPSPIAAIDLIKTSMRLIRVLATGETPSADQVNDGLSALNDVLETWSTESLTVSGTLAQTFATTPGVGLYTIGTGGTWNSPRPIDIIDAYCTLSGVDFPLEIIGQSQYDAIGLKSIPGNIVDQLCYVNTYPLGTAYLWPVPTTGTTVTMNMQQPLVTVANSAQTLNLLPGYARALQYSLAVELAPQYGIELSQQFGSVARSTLARIKRANRTPVLSSFGPELINRPGVLWQRGW